MKTVLFFLSLTTFSLFSTPLQEQQALQGVKLLENISQAFTELAETAMPATVSIKCTLCPSSNGPSPHDMFGDEFFRRFFGPQFPQQQPEVQTAGGSGFLISSDGFIVTNSHVVKEATKITVTLNDGREYEASIKGADARTDLAVLKIEGEDLPFLTFGDSDQLRVGEWVVAAGNPFGLEGTITKGIVSAKGRQDLGIATYEDFIQTDAPINPGNSGGPLLNVRGEVVGINTAIFSRSGGYMGIGLAIPSKMVKPVIDQILDNGKVTRGYLGVVLQPVDKELASALGMKQVEGVLISDLIPDGPAAKGGLKSGDILLECNGKTIKSVNAFRNDIAMLSPGSEVSLKVLRKNKKKKFTITLGQQKDPEKSALELSKKLGIELENLTPEMAVRLNYSSDASGVVISKVDPNSSAALAGLRPGFLITGIATDWNEKKPIHNIEEFDQVLENIGDKKYIILIVRHQNFQRFYTIKLS